ncbi:uncharacterized protein B0I36DRAFT_138923 [Microdochium trichocladiopsis]|uniref:Anaphase-promoting complex subunit CDC26 n=1 Tax=Microdochium trichocladiopsis TaxID=1682393 RepID=A0A9P9BKX1_9PEZI|nr:uncharacterized protein B0I36DRAFT_138923 [Microdochium trichocladiopsis]KAH7027472.1 hypothetical protein B0I36DRAFT_138923 [Microdochium trichocladiopsis]
MLRRPPTVLSLTAEDIAAYEDMRAQKASLQQQQHHHQHQQHSSVLHSRHPMPQQQQHQLPHQQQGRAAMLDTSPRSPSPVGLSSSADEAMADAADMTVDLDDEEDEDDEDDDHEDSYYAQRSLRRAAAMDDPFVSTSHHQPSSRGGGASSSASTSSAAAMQPRVASSAGGGPGRATGTARTLFAGQAPRASRLQRITGAADGGAAAGGTGSGRGVPAGSQQGATRATAATTARQASIEPPGAPSRLTRSREERIGIAQPQLQGGAAGLGSLGGNPAGGAASGTRRR